MNFSKLIKNNIVLMFLLVLICLLFINTASASSLIINSTNGNNYKNLIDNFNGTDIKFEDVEIDDFSYEFTKKVNITGKNATLKNDGSKNLFVFSGGSNGGSISDLYLSKSYIAITVRDVSGFTLKNLKIEHANREGMSIYRSSNIKLYNNTVKYSTTGNNYGVEIWMETVTNVSIVNNNINHNNRYGLQVGGGNNISVLNNNISNNTHKFGTNAWFNGVNGLIIIGNNITSANGAFVTFPNVRRGSGLSLDGNDKNVLIANNNISNNGLHGITMGDRTNVNITICNNIINNNGKFISLGYGIHVKSQSTTTLCNNTIIGNPIGIYLNGGLNNKIYNNFVSNSAVSFLGLSGIITGAISIGNNAANNIIYNNSIIRSNNGIHSLNGRNNTIENNIISNNAEHGINVDGGSVIIVNNNINNNTRDGVYLTSSNNVVLNNTILNNTIGIRVINSNNNTLNNNKIRKNNKTGISVVGSKNSMIGNLIDSNSENGVIIIGNDNLIQSSNILNHTVIGVNVSGDNNIINYNRFYNAFGLYSNGNNNNINLNWWSLNDVNSQVNGTGYILNWYVLKIATNGNITFANKTYILTGKTNVDASHYFETNVNVPNDKNLLPFFNMIYIDNNGVNHTAVVNDVLQYDFTANGKVVSIRSLLDRENLVVTFNFTLNLINTTILISNYSGYIGDNVTFVATLKDTNGNLINNKSVDFFC